MPTKTLAHAATAALVLGGGAALAQTPKKLTRLLDVYPASTMTAVTGDSRGDWVFVAEGGSIAIVDFRGVDSATPPDDAQNPFFIPSRLKRVDAGDYGVRAADLMLDPAAQLETNQPAGTVSDGREDILYIAGGLQGLWAMRADTDMASNARNDAVRIDDSETNVVTEQEGRRYCNQLGTIEVDGTTYLLATFGRKNGESVLRFYDIDDVRDRLDWQTSPTILNANGDGTGWELAATWQVTLGQHPNVSAAPNALAHAFPLGIDVDLVSSETGPHVYVAMGCHGVLRIEPVRDPVTSLVTGWTTNWGPVLGTGTPYAQAHPGYKNFDYRDVSRAVTFDNLDRSERPVFVDVAVQRDATGKFLYCAVDHLNWMRFDLADTWGPSMSIDHHEGDWVTIPRPADWDGKQGVSALTSYGAGKEAMRATDMPPLDGDPDDPWRRDVSYASRISLVDPPPNSSFSAKLVVVTGSGVPFLGSTDVLTPTFPYSYDFQKQNGVDLSTAGHVQNYRRRSTITVYDSSNLPNDRNEIGWIASGGKSLFVPPDQSATGSSDVLKMIHNNWIGNEVATAFGHGLGRVLSQACVSFYDIGTPPDGTPPLAFVRDPGSEDAKGRFNNGVGYCISDPRILTTAHNDSLPYQDGILWTRPFAGDPMNPATVTFAQAVPTLLGDDRRMETGIICPQDNQWVDSASAGSNQDWHFIAGQGKAPDAMGDEGSGWSLVRHTVETDGSTFLPVVTWDWRRVFGQPVDRWFHMGRTGYMSASTTDEAFSAFAATVPDPANGTHPDDYIFFARPGSADGVVVVDRAEFLDAVDGLNGTPPGAASFREDWPGGLSTEFELNTHPEWDPIPIAANSNDPSSEWWNNIPAAVHQGTSIAWAPRMIHFPESVSGQPTPTEEWILAVPCHTLSNPHSPGTPFDFMGTNASSGVDLDAAFSGWFSAPLDPEVAFLMSNYSHGLVQFWRFTDMPTGFPSSTGRPAGTSDLPFIVVPHAETSVWRVEPVVIEPDEGPDQVLLVVATFGGYLYVYDITDLPDQPRTPTASFAAPMDTWEAPQSFLRDVRLNVRAIEVDLVDDDTIHVYAGMPGYGIEVLNLERVGTSAAWALSATTELIETAADPHDIELRPAYPALGLTKTLLVSDGRGGLRAYGEEL